MITHSKSLQWLDHKGEDCWDVLTPPCTVIQNQASIIMSFKLDCVGKKRGRLPTVKREHLLPLVRLWGGERGVVNCTISSSVS